MELMIVVAITATIAAFGIRSLAKSRVDTQRVEAKAHTVLEKEDRQWALAGQNETIEVDGQMVSLQVWERKW